MSNLLQALREAQGLLQRGHIDDAVAACQRALAIDERSADAWNMLGLARYQRGDRVGARLALDRAVAANPRYVNAWENLAALCETEGDAHGAAHALARAVGAMRAPTHDAWYDVGLRAFRMELYDLAGDCFAAALMLRDDSMSALNALTVTRDRQRRAHEARQLADRLLVLAPNHPTAMQTFAAVYSRATETDDLRRSLELSLALLTRNPRDAQANDCAAVVLGKLGEREAALRHAREAVDAAPAVPEFVFTLGRLLEEDGRLAEADELLTSARRHTQANAHVLRQHGTVKLRLGQFAEAASLFEHALKLAPTDQAAISQLALALDNAGQGARARALIGFDRLVRRVRLDVPAPFTDAASFNAALANDIRHHSRLRFEPVGLAAKGGYLTEDLTADPTPAIVGLEQSLRAAIDAYIASLTPDPEHPFLRRLPRAYRLDIWATRVAAQGVIDTHIHDESWLSGAYYVELPPGIGEDDDHAGWLEFGRGHHGLPEPLPETVRVMRPEVGTLTVFPSYMFHRTLPFAGTGERLSVSFDLTPIE